MTKDTYVENIARTFWKNVDALRQFHQLSWAEVCGDGVSSSGFRNNTAPTLAKMARIAERLHTTVPELLNDSMLPEPTEKLYVIRVGIGYLSTATSSSYTVALGMNASNIMYFRSYEEAVRVRGGLFLGEAKVELWS